MDLSRAARRFVRRHHLSDAPLPQQAAAFAAEAGCNEFDALAALVQARTPVPSDGWLGTVAVSLPEGGRESTLLDDHLIVATSTTDGTSQAARVLVTDAGGVWPVPGIDVEVQGPGFRLMAVTNPLGSAFFDDLALGALQLSVSDERLRSAVSVLEDQLAGFLGSPDAHPAPGDLGTVIGASELAGSLRSAPADSTEQPSTRAPAAVPLDERLRSHLGPRATATVAYRSGSVHLSVVGVSSAFTGIVCATIGDGAGHDVTVFLRPTDEGSRLHGSGSWPSPRAAEVVVFGIGEGLLSADLAADLALVGLLDLMVPADRSATGASDSRAEALLDDAARADLGADCRIRAVRIGPHLEITVTGIDPAVARRAAVAADDGEAVALRADPDLPGVYVAAVPWDDPALPRQLGVFLRRG